MKKTTRAFDRSAAALHVLVQQRDRGCSAELQRDPRCGGP